MSILDSYRDYLKQFYARPDSVFELLSAIAVALLAYAELLPFWLVLILVVIRHIGGVKGMKKANE